MPPIRVRAMAHADTPRTVPRLGVVLYMKLPFALTAALISSSSSGVFSSAKRIERDTWGHSWMCCSAPQAATPSPDATCKRTDSKPAGDDV